MASMGKYCKAYILKDLRRFKGWKEHNENARSIDRDDGKPTDASPRQLADEDYLFVQENFVVTDGIFLDENIIFDDITQEWKTFCETTLDFSVPNYEPAPPDPAAEIEQRTTSAKNDAVV